MNGLRGAAGSEVGRKYRANFDVAHLDLEPLLAVVADGMGDSEGSALAGRATVDIFVERIRAARGDVGPKTIRDAVEAAQDRVIDIGRGDIGLAGCTLTALLAGADGMWVTQLGDSRVYRFRDDLLELLTVDHTMAWLGVAHGLYSLDSPQAAAARYHLTRYVGHAMRPEPDVLSIVPAPGDIYLLCSDGIAEQVPYPRLREILRLHIEPAAMVERLLAAADVAGGEDNATAVVVTVPF
ncbi:MAG: SpoIIE family protein phosphatase [Actinophytocola sp.]|uniref:PP2C family protein-serine/threonine phosphatase n=1 Tax=Actinophytocola sp. TaxID=1872138 RepID=UPI001320A046|nr:protein phosphatase 2C domain-containing protein [Actinophytocola sp.]MPZ82030.1 SpoIIE family protein phosphatase [Actinophytocola sp.]